MKGVLSPKELGAAIGVSESSLKRWADSGRLRVARTGGGHRRIDLSEAIRFVRAHGFDVERPALLGLEDIETVSDSPAADDPGAAIRVALESGDGARARGLALTHYLEGMPLSLIVDRMIAPAMRAIGERWRHGEDGIMIEHRAADLCSQILGRIRDLAVVGPDRPTAVGAAPADDPYLLPSLMAASVLASEGWDEVNLAANTPVSVLARAASDADAHLVWLAVSAERPRATLAAEIGELRAALESAGVNAGIVLGGPALASFTFTEWPGVYHARSMTELAAFAQGLRSGRSENAGGEGVPLA